MNRVAPAGSGSAGAPTVPTAAVDREDVGDGRVVVVRRADRHERRSRGAPVAGHERVRDLRVGAVAAHGEGPPAPGQRLEQNQRRLACPADLRRVLLLLVRDRPARAALGDADAQHVFRLRVPQAPRDCASMPRRRAPRAGGRGGSTTRATRAPRRRRAWSPTWSSRRDHSPGAVPATTRFRTGCNALSKPLTRASEPSDHAVKPNSAPDPHRLPSKLDPVCPRARFASERQNVAFSRDFL